MVTYQIVDANAENAVPMKFDRAEDALKDACEIVQDCLTLGMDTCLRVEAHTPNHLPRTIARLEIVAPMIGDVLPGIEGGE